MKRKPQPRWPMLITSELTHLSAWNNYTFFHYKDGSKKLMSRTMKQWQQRLPHFIRIGRGLLVAPDHITGWSTDYTTAFVNDKPLTVSRRTAVSFRRESPASAAF